MQFRTQAMVAALMASAAVVDGRIGLGRFGLGARQDEHAYVTFSLVPVAGSSSAASSHTAGVPSVTPIGSPTGPGAVTTQTVPIVTYTVVPSPSSPGATTSDVSAGNSSTSVAVTITSSFPVTPLPTTMVTSATYFTNSSSSSAPAPTIGYPTNNSSAPTGGPSPTPSPGGGSGGAEAPLTGSCKNEGIFNCIDGKSYQQCASGHWSAVMRMAPTTSCALGQSTNLWARDVNKDYSFRGRRRVY
ncbi:putative chitin- domain 3 protein [Rosellinia necatrix]|uniref:Putative chitin-domain 3 protein n=1 Tax=Rosellinia necatrix TaxID=77044 RepID=A0A1W2TUL4_ROSNE|nr:putative chitin- domain 3 protein [Rosellinia necatrix]